jgi:hypothetical protein
VFMSAAEPLARVADKHRTRSHEFAVPPGTVLKRAGHNDRYRGVRMLFFKRAVVRAGRTNDIPHSPAVSAGEQSGLGRRSAFNRNFYQEMRLPQTLQRIV